MNERTKELKSNALADWLESRLESSSQMIKPMLIGVVVLFVLVLTVMALRSRNEAQMASMWEDYLQAGDDSAALLAVAKKHEGTVVGLWAQTTRASNDLQSAAQMMHSDRLQAKERIDSAIEDLQAVVDATAGQTGEALRAQALFGLGQAYELNFDVDQAREYYEMLQNEGGEDAEALVEYAKQRIQVLDQDEIKNFYTWYSTQTPGLGRGRTTPPGQMPPGQVPPISDAPDLPQDLSTLPNFPDLSVPEPPKAEAEEPAEGSQPSESPTEKPPAKEPPAEESPAEESPAEESPAEESPAEESPAEESPAEESPAEESPAEESPAEESPAEESPAEESPATGN